MSMRIIIPGLLLTVALVLARDVHAQQRNGPGAVEEFAPQLDVGYAMRPSVGMFGITELMMAALEANLAEVTRLVEQGADIEETDDTGGTPLMWAVQGGDLDTINFLLDRGADVDAVGGRNTTALMIAVISGKEDIGVRLLEAGATFGGELYYQQDYLEYAADKGRANLVRALIRHGANIGESGTDALCFAVRKGHVDAARSLVEAGVDVNQRGNQSNDLPMIHALQAQNLAIVQLLVEAGADLNRMDKANRVSIMHYAALTGQPSIVSYLLDNGAVIDEKEADQMLGSAISKGSMEMADLLVARGATISQRNLFNAMSRKQYEMADAFADAIGIESMDDYSIDRLLEHADMTGHQTMVDELLGVIDSREQHRPVRLLFETVEDGNCALRVWDPRARVVSTVLDSLSCDAGIFTARRQATLFVVTDEGIGVHSLDKEFPTYTLKVPTQEIEARIDELRGQFAQRYAGNYDWVSAEIATVGYLDDGQIAIVTRTGGPADGTYASQFTWNGDAWTLTETQGCHRFDSICRMPGVDGRSIGRWPLRRAVWHTALQRNTGFVARRNDGYSDGRSQGAVILEFQDQRSELGYEISGSDHCAEECTFTDSVTIRPTGAQTLRIVLANSRVWIADRYMLVRPVKQNSRLYDLGTGEDILGDIGRATWMQ